MHVKYNIFFGADRIKKLNPKQMQANLELTAVRYDDCMQLDMFQQCFHLVHSISNKGLVIDLSTQQNTPNRIQ